MKLLLLIAPLLFSSACMFRAQPLGGASTLQVDSNWSADQREAELEKREMHPTVIVTVRNSKTGVSSVRVDRSAMAQDGYNFRLPQYLDTLKAEGIASDIEDPAPYLRRGALVQFYWLLGSVPVGVSAAFMMASLSDSGGTDDGADLIAPSVLGLSLLGGYIGGFIHRYKITEPARQAVRKAQRKRSKWSQEFNKGLAQKLGLIAAPAQAPAQAPIKKDGVLLVPARN
jgi:hypothetical protein